MGHYTELLFKCELKGNTPQKVIDTLHWMADIDRSGEYPPENLPELSSRMSMIFHGGSAYHQTFKSEFYYDDIARAWFVRINSSIKNYDNDYQKFLEWIEPYVHDHGVLGWIQDEDYYNPPTLIQMNPFVLITAGMDDET